jgi:hypothetical protein
LGIFTPQNKVQRHVADHSFASSKKVSLTPSLGLEKLSSKVGAVLAAG